MRSAILLAAGVALLVAGPPPALAADLGHLGIRVVERAGAALPPVDPATATRPAGALPDSRPGMGRLDVREAWLTRPTERYGHGVLGHRVEAGGLRVVAADGSAHEIGLDGDSVFEDLRPRVADLDGDGREEVVVVRSYLAAGAALAVYGFTDGCFAPRAETAPIGLPNRWLNPAGIGDFDGDGRPEIAYVETPHIGGILRVVALDRNRLVEEARTTDVSNHAIGSRALGLSAVLDVDGDGADDLLVPADGRRTLRVLVLANGAVRELGRHTHKGRIATDFRIADCNGNGRADVAYGLDDGTLVELLR